MRVLLVEDDLIAARGVILVLKAGGAVPPWAPRCPREVNATRNDCSIALAESRDGEVGEALELLASARHRIQHHAADQG
jgi:hypothetical protein